MKRTAYTGARIFDGQQWWERSAIVVAGDRIEAIIAADSPTDAERVPMDGGMLVPGFVDLQVNGGGGVLLNDAPTADSIRAICAAHAPFGTTACLPTFITDRRENRDRLLAAAAEASGLAIPGYAGLHLEGPHLAPSRKGAHDATLMGPLTDADLDALVAARARIPSLLLTVAAEQVTANQVTRLREAGIVVSLGHSDATYAAARERAEAGASMVTHLFNAQSQIGPRDPGLVGAALDLGQLHAGLIADGIHVHPVNIGLALAAKRGPGRIFLVTDAMSMTGTDATSFELGGRTVYRKDGALRLADGTLAGADLTMIDAVAFMHRTIGVALDEVLRMASLYPAEAMGLGATHGHLAPGARADIVHLGDDLSVRGTLIGGATAWAA